MVIWHFLKFCLAFELQPKNCENLSKKSVQFSCVRFCYFLAITTLKFIQITWNFYPLSERVIKVYECDEKRIWPFLREI